MVLLDLLVRPPRPLSRHPYTSPILPVVDHLDAEQDDDGGEDPPERRALAPTSTFAPVSDPINTPSITGIARPGSM
jgi:hypothetical protein